VQAPAVVKSQLINYFIHSQCCDLCISRQSIYTAAAAAAFLQFDVHDVNEYLLWDSASLEKKDQTKGVKLGLKYGLSLLRQFETGVKTRLKTELKT